MWISKINLLNFRNYKTEKIELGKDINIFYGENAQGKTNIIESIFFGSMGKSFRAKKDLEVIKLNENEAIVEIFFEKKDRDGKIKIEISNKKNVFLNGVKLKKLSQLLGNINIVIFTPDDINILKGGPQNRRKFLDIMISQLKPNYMYNLNLYKKTIEQRNKYLRQIREENKTEKLLDIWDEKLVEYEYQIYKYRKYNLEKIKEKKKNP
ncbi:MAG: DNA replication/repair protein RecF [Clostridia bacterium]